MRMLLRVRIPTAAGNSAVSSGAIEGIIKDFANKAKPEAAYFYADQGHRAASFIFDMQDSSEIPALVEPLFTKLDAEVALIPVMNLEDLQKGLSVFGSQS